VEKERSWARSLWQPLWAFPFLFMVLLFQGLQANLDRSMPCHRRKIDYKTQVFSYNKNNVFSFSLCLSIIFSSRGSKHVCKKKLNYISNKSIALVPESSV
jgi:hypothetical protein